MPSTIVSASDDSTNGRLARGRFRRMLDGALFVPRGITLFLKRPGLWLLG